ncbi:MAG: hypothetical protein Ct9H90mP13_04770 [Pseudomonadota bacterium]|nr:MAG: hypothetical protein Ct9H90mP13_04770 [Pseudomonadota bacterium]
MNPEIGKASAEEAAEAIKALLSDTDMLFITLDSVEARVLEPVQLLQKLRKRWIS